jgi:hypothetical protein
VIRTAYPLIRRRHSRVEVATPAGATARPDESGFVFSVPGHTGFASRRTARIDFVCNVTFAMAVLGVAVAFVWPVSNRHPPVPVITSTLALAEVSSAGPSEPVEQPGAPVRIRNAFDATEVFEFPHGTTKSEAREAVGELLLSRARDRRAEGLALRRVRNLQTDRGGAQQPVALVARLHARAMERSAGRPEVQAVAKNP